MALVRILVVNLSEKGNPWKVLNRGKHILKGANYLFFPVITIEFSPFFHISPFSLPIAPLPPGLLF